MDGRIDMIIDGGAVGIGIESTIVDMTGDRPTILRPGYITPEMIRDIVGDVTIDPAITGMNNALRPKAPGMKYTHYAPKGELSIVEGDRLAAAEKIRSLVAEKRHRDTRLRYCVTLTMSVFMMTEYARTYTMPEARRTR